VGPEGVARGMPVFLFLALYEEKRYLPVFKISILSGSNSEPFGTGTSKITIVPHCLDKIQSWLVSTLFKNFNNTHRRLAYVISFHWGLRRKKVGNPFKAMRTTILLRKEKKGFLCERFCTGKNNVALHK
jgi:hypothetical protein